MTDRRTTIDAKTRQAIRAAAARLVADAPPLSAETRERLAAWAGVDPDAASQAIDEIVARCAGLPLALAVAAARAATSPAGAGDGGPPWVTGSRRRTCTAGWGGP